MYTTKPLRPPPYFTVRRLTLADAPPALSLYAAQGRDGLWAYAQGPDTLWENVVFWGGFLKRELALCIGVHTEPGAVCASVGHKNGTSLPLCAAASKTGVLPPDCTLFLPPAASADGTPYLAHFLQIVLAQCLQQTPAQKSGGLAALLPVKTGTALADAFFAAGLSLCAMRPLFQLRPHYIFMQTTQPESLAPQAEVQTVSERSIMIPMEDSLSLSRLLEQGHVGTSLVRGSVVMQSLAQ